MRGFVYLARGGGYCKIGRATNVRKRIGGLSTPFDIELLHTITADDVSAAELSLHQRFVGQRVRGEWFDLSDQDIAWICAIAHIPAEEKPAGLLSRLFRRETVPLPTLYTVEEAAELIGVTRQTILNWITSGKVKATKFGRAWRITEAEVARITEQGVVEDGAVEGRGKDNT